MDASACASSPALPTSVQKCGVILMVYTTFFVNSYPSAKSHRLGGEWEAAER